MDPSSFSLTNVAAALNIFTVLCMMFFLVYRKFRSNQETKTVEENKTMASSSLVPSSLPHNLTQHVFPSFHGPDVRRSFLSHLLKEFRNKGIDPFIDNNIERSKSIDPELIEAIRGSRIAIVLLSKNYASSTWCLDELVEIIKCREELTQTVMTIFYEVDPTDVKKQTGHFGEVFRRTCIGKTKEDTGRWKHALAEVAKIAGYHSSNWGDDTEMIEAIAIDVSNKLSNSTVSSDFDRLVGMESHMRRMAPFLQFDSDEVKVIGIWGPSGIGKTTIARFLFNQHSQQFQLTAFMENIRESYPVPPRSDYYSVQKSLQEQFMSKIINYEGFKIPHLGSIKDRLKDKKVLIVLDDVNHRVQLEAMAKEISWFGRGSLIIITTQDRRLLQAHRVNHIYKVNLPSSNEALQIFCMYAFGQKTPKDGFENLAWEVTSLAGSLPLGLMIMGSNFRGMSVHDWTEALPRLRTRLDGEIESILKYSYDALCDEDKNLFLHIACFFRFEGVRTLEECLANSPLALHVKPGIRVLTEKSLIYFEGGRIEMHELLLQLGRDIARKPSISERQFLFGATDIDEVLNDDKADTSKVIGLFLISSDDDMESRKITREIAFERFCNLQFLNFYDDTGYFSPNLNSLPPKLKFLSWDCPPMQCWPSGFQTEFLVKLDLGSSMVEKLWEGIQPFSNLKEMDLGHSVILKELPDLSTATNLRVLDLRHCSRLRELPPSMKNLRKLSCLILKGCSELEVNLTNINLESLTELDLSGCSSLKCHPETSTNMKGLKSSGTAIKEVSSLVMRHLPFHSELEMSNSQIQEVDPWVGRVSNLRRLQLYGMPKMVSLPQLPYSVTELEVYDCESLKRLDCSFRNPDIRYLIFADCFKLNQETKDLIIHAQPKEYAVLPDGEMPECFNNRASGSSLTVKLNYKPLPSSMKFKACIRLAGAKEFWAGNRQKNSFWYKQTEHEEVRCTITSNQNVTAFRKRLKPYEEHLYIFEVEVEDVTSTEFVFEFKPIYRNEEYTWKIKECGVMQLLEVPSCDEHYKCCGDGSEDSDMEQQILKLESDREPSGERKWWRRRRA